ncbi:MAG: hypothetical protein Q9202_007586 [Teloschistes flavicans]
MIQQYNGDDAHVPHGELSELESFVRSHIIQSLQQKGLAVNYIHEPTNYEKWTVDKDGSIIAEPENPHRWNGWQFMGAELKTPIQRWEQSLKAFFQLKDALQAIREEFPVFVNESCGLHVHVGNGPSGFPLSTVRQFAKIVTIFERQLATVHPHHRVNNIHCRPPSSNFNSQDLVHNVRILEEAGTLTQLIDRMSYNLDGSERGFAYNMRNLIDDEAPPTIEFRQHEATLEVPAIGAWTELVCGLVDSAHRIVQLWTHGPSEPATLVELLRKLQMYRVADHYEWAFLHAHPTSNEPHKFAGKAWIQDTLSLTMDLSETADTASELSEMEEDDEDDEPTKYSAQDQMDWDMEYALHDPILEVKQDDDEDKDYQ